MKIYLAGSISGMSYEVVANYFHETAYNLRLIGYHVITPMTGKSELRTDTKLKADGYHIPAATNHAIAERDRWMVEQADVVYCNLTMAQIVSIGSVMELAWAQMLGKHTVVAMQTDNIHRHAFVLEAADIVYETHEKAMDYLGELILG